jgi:branched-subunit amino acid ABC-type transport system permease component
MTRIVLVGGAIAGAQYAVSALCISLTYRTSRVLNLAQGSVALAAATTFALLDEWPTALAAVAGVGLAVALGLAIEMTTRAEEPLARLTAVAGWFLAIGSALTLREGLLLPRPILGRGSVEVLDVRIAYSSVVVVAIALTVPVLAWLVLARTGIGALIVAVADAPGAATVLGLDVIAVRRIVWSATQGLVGIVGILAAPTTGLDPVTSFMLLAGGLAAALVCGLERLAGPVTAGFGLGFLTAWLGGKVTPSLRDALVLVIVTGVLMVRRSTVGDVVAGRV